MRPNEPITRKEMYYSAILGDTTQVPEPITREEQYLNAIVENGTGGGGGGGAYTLPVATETALGGVRAPAKTDAETEAVTVDEDGKLWTKPVPDDVLVEGDVDGRNLAINSKQYTISATTAETVSIDCASADIRNKLFGTTISVSFDYTCDIVSGTIILNTSKTWQRIADFTTEQNGSGHIEKVVNLNSHDPVYTDAGCIYLQRENKNAEGTVTLSNVKVEKGSVPTPYTPAPEDLVVKGEVDGRNLFVMGDSEPGYLTDDSGIVLKPAGSGEVTSDYIEVSPNEDITIQMWATGTVKPSWVIHYAWFKDKSLASNIGSVTKLSGGDIGITYGVATGIAPQDAKYIRVSARLYSDGRVKIERGSIATEWTPAPEDVVVRSELEALVARVTALEKQVGISADEVDNDLDITSLSTKGGEPL